MNQSPSRYAEPDKAEAEAYGLYCPSDAQRIKTYSLNPLRVAAEEQGEYTDHTEQAWGTCDGTMPTNSKLLLII